MTDQSKISELIERSALGTAGARSLRGRTPPEVAQRIIDRAAEHERTTARVTDNPRNDADLLLRACDSDLAAWEELVLRYGAVVSATVRSFRLQEADALDAVQMTWLRLVENAHRVRYPERLAGWLATTARRECLRILRQAKHTPDPVSAVADTVADPPVGPEQRSIKADAARMLWELVEALSPRQQILLQALFTDHARTNAEVARTAGIPLGSIGPTRARALRQLRRMLDESPRQRTLLRALFTNHPPPYTEITPAAEISPSVIESTRTPAPQQLQRRFGECVLMATGHQPM